MKTPGVLLHAIIVLTLSALPAAAQFRDCDGDGIDDRDQLEENRSTYLRGLDPEDITPDFVEGTPEVDGMSLWFPAAPAHSDVSIVLDAALSSWVNGSAADQYLLVYLNNTFIGRGVENPGEDTFVVPQATWETLRNGAEEIEVTVEFSVAASPDPNSSIGYPIGGITVSYTLDRDMDDNGWLDDCIPDGDPSGPDSDGDGVSDNIDRSPNTIADPTLVDVYGRLLRVPRLDADEDGDVDVDDFDLLDPTARDVDGDGDFDLHDLASLLQGARGPGVAADPAFLQELQLFKAHTYGPEDLDLKLWYKPLDGVAHRSYDNGNLLCQALYGTHLATIDKTGSTPLSQVEQINQLHSLIEQSGSDMSWIGMRWQRQHTSFQWENGQFFDTSDGSHSAWVSGQPIPGSSFFLPGQDDYYVFAVEEGGTFGWINGDGVTASLGSKTIQGFAAQLPANTVPAAPVTNTETVTVTLDSSFDGQAVAPGQSIDWTISFEVSSGDNSGLALLVTDLEQDAGNPASFDLPAGNAAPAAMLNFAAPLGFTGPGGFGGQQTGSAGALNLAQIGGAQNTFGGASSDPTQGQGTTVVTGLGQSGSTVFVTGSFSAPATLGTYTFNLANTLACVLKTVGGPGQGSEIVPATIVLAQGSITIEVNNVPVINLLGNNPVTHEAATPYTEAGATANDAEDGNISGALVVTNSVNVDALGSYSVTYNVTDSAGLSAKEVTRTVNVVDTTPPVITLLGEDPVMINAGAPYSDPGATALDSLEGDLSTAITMSGSVNTLVHGTNVLTYHVTDSSGNVAIPVTRTVFVDGDEPPTFEEATVLITIDEATTGIVYTASADDPDGGVRFDHPGYIALFHTDEGTGAVATDALGSGLELSFHADRWTVDPDGPGGENVLNTKSRIVPNDTSWFTVDDFTVANGLTVSEWIRFDNLQTTIYDPVIWKFGDMQVVDYDGRLRTTGAPGINIVSPFVDGEWAHLIFSIDPDGNVTIYLNGAEIANSQMPFDNTLTGNIYGRDWATPLDGTNGARSDLTLIDGVLSSTLAERLYQSALGGHLGDVLRYSLGSDGDELFFMIDAYTGELSVTEDLRFESPQDSDGDNVYQVEVIATDDEGLSSSQLVEVTINNSNIAPVITGTLVDPIEEVSGYYVYDFTVADDDPSALVMWTDDNRFTVSGDSAGGYRVHRKSSHRFDYEIQKDYSFELIVSDGVEEDRVNISFTLTNINDNTPVVTFTSAGSINENVPGAVVGTLEITDQDGETTFYFDILPQFEVAADQRTIKLKDGVAFDHEDPSTSTLELIVSDAPFSDPNSNWAVVVHVVEVLNVNDVGPSDLQLSGSLQVVENDPGAVIGSLSASDADGPSLSFSVSDPRFEVEGTNLKLLDGLFLDSETEPSVTLEVTVSDGEFEESRNFTISVLNVDEGGPTNLALSHASIAENTTGVIGQFSATDVDGDAITFSITDSRFTVTGTTLALTTAIDYESLDDGSVALEVTASGGGDSITETLVITIEDLNEAPIMTMTLGTTTGLTSPLWELPVLENVRQVTVASSADPGATRFPMSFVASDVDGDALTWILTGADAAAFAVDSDTGAMNFVIPADFEAPGDLDGDSIYEVNVTVSDGEFSSNTISLLLTIQDEADAAVVGSHLFYEGSAWDDEGDGLADDDAIATDKSALLPGGVATFANYTSYSKGINGIMVDIAGLPGTPDLSDFAFKTGNDNDPSGWAAAPDPLSPIAVRDIGGGVSRVTLIWNGNNLDVVVDANEAVAGAWLEVTVKATANTGLAEDDVFYFGNAIGETGNDSSSARVNTADVLLIRNNPKTFLDPAGITDPHDLNRDTKVNTQDRLLARNHKTTFLDELKLIDLSGGASSTSFEPADTSLLRQTGSAWSARIGTIDGRSVLTFQGPAGAGYEVHASPRVEGGWELISGEIIETGPGRFQLDHAPIEGGRLFYKIVPVIYEEDDVFPSH